MRAFMLVLFLGALWSLFLALTTPHFVRPWLWVVFGSDLAAAVVVFGITVIDRKLPTLYPQQRGAEGSEQASIRISRSEERLRDTGRPYRVIIDDKVVCGLWNGESRVFAVRPGHHRVRIGMDWSGSEEVTVALHDGETKALSCRPKRSPPGPIRMFSRRGWVDLYEENADSRPPLSAELPN
jgi:hypothetical protein